MQCLEESERIRVRMAASGSIHPSFLEGKGSEGETYFSEHTLWVRTSLDHHFSSSPCHCKVHAVLVMVHRRKSLRTAVGMTDEMEEQVHWWGM